MFLQKGYRVRWLVQVDLGRRRDLFRLRVLHYKEPHSIVRSGKVQCCASNALATSLVPELLVQVERCQVFIVQNVRVHLSTRRHVSYYFFSFLHFNLEAQIVPFLDCGRRILWPNLRLFFFRAGLDRWFQNMLFERGTLRLGPIPSRPSSRRCRSFYSGYFSETRSNSRLMLQYFASSGNSS